MPWAAGRSSSWVCVAQRGRAGAGDPDRFGGDPIRFRRGQDVRCGEAPGAVDEDANAESLALARGDALDPAALDRDALLEPPDDADVGVSGAPRGCRIESAKRQVSHARRSLAEGPASDSEESSLWPGERRSLRRWRVRRPPGRSGTGRARTPAPRRPAARSRSPGRACEAPSTRSSRPRARTRASPMPPMTSAIPSPNATTRMNPNAGRPAAIEPSRISSALVDGIRPPARPRTNRLRHEIVVPAGGRWLWLTPPWLWTPGRRRVARRVRASRGRGRRSWSWCGCVVVVGVAVGMRQRRAIARPSERASGDAPRRSASSRRWPRSRWPPRPAPSGPPGPARGPPPRRRSAPPGRGCRACATRVTDSPSPAAWSGVPRVPTRYAAISVLPCPGVRA